MIDKTQKFTLADKYLRIIKVNFPSLAWDDAKCLSILTDLLDEQEKIISFQPSVSESFCQCEDSDPIFQGENKYICGHCWLMIQNVANEKVLALLPHKTK